MLNFKIIICLVFSLLLNQPWLLAAEDTSNVSIENEASRGAGDVAPAQPSGRTHLTSNTTFNQTHTVIRSMILNQKVVYEQPLETKSSGEFKHWHDVSYGVTSYSADQCQIVYGRRLSRPEVHGHAALSSRKGVSFDMKQVERIALQAWSDFDPQIGRSSSLPSKMIMFYGPATVMSNGKGSKRSSHGVTVYSENAERTLQAFQHLKTLCTS